MGRRDGEKRKHSKRYLSTHSSPPSEMTPQPRGNAEDVSGKRSGTERPFFGLANQPNKSRAGANAGIRALPRNVESRYGGLGEAGVLRWFPPKLARLATRW